MRNGDRLALRVGGTRVRAATLYVSLVAFMALVEIAGSSGGDTFTVNSSADSVDARIGDGVCETKKGECTLRAAIMESNLSASECVIVFSVDEATLSIPGGGEDLSEMGDLDIASDMAINGGEEGVHINTVPSFDDRVFEVFPTADATVAGVTIRGADPPKDTFLALDDARDETPRDAGDPDERNQYAWRPS